MAGAFVLEEVPEFGGLVDAAGEANAFYGKIGLVFFLEAHIVSCWCCMSEMDKSLPIPMMAMGSAAASGEGADVSDSTYW